MDHDPRLSLLSPLPTLSMPYQRRPSRTARTQGREGRSSTKSSRTLDPADLSARLTNVIAEREAAEGMNQSGRSQSINPRANNHLPGTRSSENRRRSHLDLADAERDGLSNQKSRAKSFHGPTGLEYSILQKAQGRGFEMDYRDRSCPLLPDTATSFAPTISYGHRAGAGATIRRASYIPPSPRPSDSRYVPQVAASQFASTATSTSMMDDPAERQNSRRASANTLRFSEPVSPHGRRRSTKASQGLWEGVHEPTIFESVATDAKPGERRSMFERAGDKSAHADARPRRMTAGDAFKAGEASDDAMASGGRESADMSHYELVNDHRVDWTQADEDAKMPRSKRLLRKADSILRMGRRGSAISRSSYGSSNASMVEGQEGNYALKSPKSHDSPNSPRSPRAVRAKSFWPFKKQTAVESH